MAGWGVAVSVGWGGPSREFVRVWGAMTTAMGPAPESNLEERHSQPIIGVLTLWPTRRALLWMAASGQDAMAPGMEELLQR